MNLTSYPAQRFLIVGVAQFIRMPAANIAALDSPAVLTMLFGERDKGFAMRGEPLDLRAKQRYREQPFELRFCTTRFMAKALANSDGIDNGLYRTHEFRLTEHEQKFPGLVFGQFAGIHSLKNIYAVFCQ